MTDAYIYDAVRLPRGKGRPGGGLQQITPVNLAATVLRALRERNELQDRDIDVEEVILGVAEPVGEQGAVIPRMAALEAGFGQHVPGLQVNRFCASGLDACNLIAAMVMSGQIELGIGGGVESMSRVPMFAAGGAMSSDPQVAFDISFVPQGISADLMATVFGYSRDDVDLFAVESQARAARAWDEGRFAKSIVAATDINGDVLLDRDEHMRPGTTMQDLARLEPSFAKMGHGMGYDGVAIEVYPEVERINHVHHAGNSAGIVDGASAVLIGTKEAGEKLGLEPRAKFTAFASTGSEPTMMMAGPSDATEKALGRAKMTTADIDLYEINEAFSAVALRYIDALGIDHAKTNVNGGAIALGHPLGATGGVLLGTLLDEVERSDAETGVVAFCAGGGLATATVIQRH